MRKFDGHDREQWLAPTKKHRLRRWRNENVSTVGCDMNSTLDLAMLYCQFRTSTGYHVEQLLSA